MSAAGDTLFPSPTPSRRIYRSVQGDEEIHSLADLDQEIHSLADLDQEIRATRALLQSGLVGFSARLHDTIPVELQEQAKDLLKLAQSYLALAQSSVDKAKAQLDSTSYILSSALHNMDTKASRFTPPGPLPTSDEYAAGVPALAYGVLQRANHIIDNLLKLSPAEETVVDFINEAKLSLDNTLQQIMLWHDLGKDLLLGEKEKAEKHIDDLQHRLLGLQLEMCGLKSELKDAQGAGEKSEEKIRRLMGDLEDEHKDAQKWKLTAEANEDKISCLKRDLSEAQGDREKWKRATEMAAKDYEEKVSGLKMNYQRELKAAKDQMELAVRKEAAARAAQESAEKAKMLSNY